MTKTGDKNKKETKKRERKGRKEKQGRLNIYMHWSLSINVN